MNKLIYLIDDAQYVVYTISPDTNNKGGLEILSTIFYVTSS